MLKQPNILNFHLILKPFSWEVWVAVKSLLVYYALILTLISFFSENRTNSTNGKEDFTFLDSLQYFSMASLQFGPDKQPVSCAGKFLRQIWSYFTLIIVSAYTANMAAIFSQNSYTSPLQSIDDILPSNRTVYTHTSYKQAIIEMNNGIINKLLNKDRIKFVNFSRSQTWSQEFSDRLESEGIWLVGSFEIEWLTKQIVEKDKMYALDGFFSRISYGFAMKSHWQYVERVSELITNYSHSGVIDHFERKYGRNNSTSDGEEDGGVKSITFQNFFGVIIATFSGGCLSLVISAIDFCNKKRLKRKKCSG